jgi:hypothetical protein
MDTRSERASVAIRAFFARRREVALVASFKKLDALMSGVTRIEIFELPALQRQRLAAVLRYIADLADPPAPKCDEFSTGVLADLNAGERAEDSDEERCCRPADLG